MTASEPLRSFLGGVTRRLRLAWGVATATVLAPVVGGAALVLVLAGWLRPWSWSEPLALALVAAAVLGVLATAFTMRIPELVAARAADRGLGTGDVLATALQFAPTDGVLGAAVQARAERSVAGVGPGDAIPIRPRWRRWLVALLLGGLALAFAVRQSPQDEQRAERAAVQEILDEEADALREQAEQLREGEPSPAEEALAERLEELARELEAADDLEAALEELAQAQSELEARVRPELLAQQAAAQGLEQSLATQPLPGTEATDASSQLEEAADALAELSEAEQQALAEQLEQLAEAQAVGNPAAADALADAAAALRDGDPGAAAEALAAAAAAQREATSSIGGQQAAAAAADATALSADRIREAAASAAAGEATGSSSGSSSSPGQGDGEGQGQGQGDGEGQGQGGGGSGPVGGNQGQAGSGVGGVGRPDGQGNSEVPPLEDASIVTPVDGAPGETVDVDGDPTGGETETTGRDDTVSGPGVAQVPLRDVVDAYSERATAALDRAPIPPSLRTQVRDYFDLLSA